MLSIQNRIRLMKQIHNLWNLLLAEVILMKPIWKEDHYIIKLVVSFKIIKMKEIEQD